MITVTPQGNVYLCNVPLENDYKNQLTFDSLQDQLTYFNSKIVKTFDNYTYMKKDNVIKVGVNIDEILGCNYLFYRNTGFSNKLYFCFITDKEYINENVTALYIETDVYQTYQFDMTFDYSFVEREHVDDDTVGKHTIPESLETGDYVCNVASRLYSSGNTTYTCVATSELPTEMRVNENIRRYNGVFSGVFYVFFDTTDETADYLSCGKFINIMDKLGKGDAIQSIFIVPAGISGTLTMTKYTVNDGSISREIYACVNPISDSATIVGTMTNILSPSTLNGYTPRNNKLFTYPYNYFYISNNVGSDVEFHYEDFVNNTAAFRIVGAITPGCSIKCFPLNYKKLEDVLTGSLTSYSYNYGLVGAKYPMCSWQSDPYTNWLTQNGINIGGRTFNAKELGYIGAGISGVSSIVSGIAEGGLVGGAIGTAGALGYVTDVMIENQRRDLIPPSVNGNISSGDVTFSYDKMDIPLFKMSVRYEYAKIIDSYFDMFGYKVNELKVPNIKTRSKWNYIKTISCEINGDIPQEHLNILKGIFNKGVTFWHDPTHFMDYSQANTILT